jgi:hypothetical protein
MKLKRATNFIHYRKKLIFGIELIGQVFQKRIIKKNIVEKQKIDEGFSRAIFSIV